MSNEITLRAIKSPQGEPTYFIRAYQKNLWSWYYIKLTKIKHEIFKRAVQSGKFDLADYGTVLASGYGDEPPSEIREQFE